jgi:hypothetical protein
MTKDEKNRYIELWHKVQGKNPHQKSYDQFFYEFVNKGYEWDFMDREESIVGVWKAPSDKEYIQGGPANKFVFSFFTSMKFDSEIVYVA